LEKTHIGCGGIAEYGPLPLSDVSSYLLGLLAKIKCSICSYQLNF
jgi:hypothetical protein